jgi:hypothetical protein
MSNWGKDIKEMPSGLRRTFLLVSEIWRFQYLNMIHIMVCPADMPYNEDKRK